MTFEEVLPGQLFHRDEGGPRGAIYVKVLKRVTGGTEWWANVNAIRLGDGEGMNICRTAPVTLCAIQAPRNVSG